MRLTIHASLPSTSSLCIERARAGEPAGFAALARVQTAGRGSRGRAWTAPEGNLNLSLLLRPDGPVASAGMWALLAGLALHDAVRACAPDATATLKWPNDILLEHADGIMGKLGGILIDSAANASGGFDWMVIGFGMNLREAPAIEGRRTACLAEAGAAPEPEVLATIVLDALYARERERLRHGDAAIRDAWLAVAHAMGTRLLVAVGGHTIEGTFAGLGPAGALCLDDGGERHILAAGEVFALDGPSAAAG